jgi:hypothetical protein
VKNPGIKPEDKDWLWEETPSVNPQVPWYLLSYEKNKKYFGDLDVSYS